MQSILVVGAGQMGRGIAQVAAQGGCRVWLSDVDIKAAEAGRTRIEKSLDKLVAKEKMSSDERGHALENILCIENFDAAEGVDICIEAASENLDIKEKIFAALDDVMPESTIFASNTSSISITKLAAFTKRPELFMGMHFMNPVPVMKLVEVIRGERTSDSTANTVVKLAESFGKTVVVSNDCPGFIVNRILMPMINEAVYAVMEGVATPADIDAAMKLGTNQPMGPLVLADFIGLDTCLAIMEVLHEGFGDTKYRPCPLLRRMVVAGKLGRKSGLGFYPYP